LTSIKGESDAEQCGCAGLAEFDIGVRLKSGTPKCDIRMTLV